MTWSTRSPQLNFLSLLALAPDLSPTGARVLYTQTPQVRTLLGENAHLDADLRALLVRDRRAEVRAAALTHTTDVAVLTAAGLGGTVTEAEAVAGNRATPVDVLEQMALSAPASVVKYLLTNPGLSTATATALASRFRVGQLWSPGRHLGSSQGSAAWRSGGVAATLSAHPEVADCWVGDPEPTVDRVIGYSPGLTGATARKLLKSRRNRNVQLALALNPFVSDAIAGTLTGPQLTLQRAALRAVLGVELGQVADLAGRASAMVADPATKQRLVAAESRTLDWMLAQSDQLGHDTAVSLATRVGEQTLEPYVMALLVNRFGAEVAAGVLDKQSISRVRAAGRFSPLLRVLTATTGRSGLTSDPVAAAHLARTLGAELGDNEAAWQVAVGLLLNAGTELRAEDLATAALGVSAS